MPREIAPGVVSWASDLDEETRRQAERTARLPVVAGHVALMPDAHLGKGATVGSVIPTAQALIPAAVGVDIGCGMIAAQTDLLAAELPDDLARVLGDLERRIPAGVGQGHGFGDFQQVVEELGHEPATPLSGEQRRRAAEQFGTLGSGNHFLEIALDEAQGVWVVLHSGSRGIGNQLAQSHIGRARALAKAAQEPLEDLDLAFFVQGTKEFDAYLRDLRWAQAYAAANRERMMHAALGVLAEHTREDARTPRLVVNCHHNYAEQEVHGGRALWVTRKGAIRARAGDLGIVPGSMGTATYIVRGRGEPRSYQSSAHGAGRRMSRTQARKRYTEDDLLTAMRGKTWLHRRARRLIDEIPESYKDIEQVLADQADLVEPVARLTQIVNYKGT